MGHSILPPPSSRAWTLVSGAGPVHPHILLLSSVSSLLTSDYDNLGLRIEGELPDGTPHMIVSE